MISISTAQTQKELTGILNLQATNLLTVLTAEEKEKEGFLTVIHTLEDLVKLNGIEKRVIAKVGGKVVAYVLAMTKAYRADIPVLIPMFSLFDQPITK